MEVAEFTIVNLNFFGLSSRPCEISAIKFSLSKGLSETFVSKFFFEEEFTDLSKNDR